MDKMMKLAFRVFSSPGTMSAFGKVGEKTMTKLGATKVIGTAGGGMVKAHFTASGDMTKLEIDPTIAGEVAMIEDLTTVAVNDAREQVDAVLQETFMEEYMNSPIIGQLMQQMGGMFDKTKPPK